MIGKLSHKAPVRGRLAGGGDHAVNRDSKDEPLYAEAIVRTVRQPLLRTER
jgi:hypothetical protein